MAATKQEIEKGYEAEEGEEEEERSRRGWSLAKCAVSSRDIRTAQISRTRVINSEIGRNETSWHRPCKMIRLAVQFGYILIEVRGKGGG